LLKLFYLIHANVLLQQKALRKLDGCPRQPASSFSKKRLFIYIVAKQRVIFNPQKDRIHIGGKNRPGRLMPYDISLPGQKT